SSRRRHTRWPRDWSSDVCSSDLTLAWAATQPSSSWILRARTRQEWSAVTLLEAPGRRLDRTVERHRQYEPEKTRAQLPNWPSTGDRKSVGEGKGVERGGGGTSAM